MPLGWSQMRYIVPFEIWEDAARCRQQDCSFMRIALLSTDLTACMLVHTSTPLERILQRVSPSCLQTCQQNNAYMRD